MTFHLASNNALDSSGIGAEEFSAIQIRIAIYHLHKSQYRGESSRRCGSGSREQDDGNAVLNFPADPLAATRLGES